MTKVENFQLFRNFTKISIYTKNDKMSMSIQITPGSDNTVKPIFVKIPKKWGFHKNDEFFTLSEFSRINVYLAKSTFLEDANSEK